MSINSAGIDYSLYLVTDSTPAILGNKDLLAVVEAALEGGVTIVQYRDKVAGTANLVSTARKLHTITRRYQVPLLINDRVDVALAVGCEGVHIGQDDLDLESTRRILGDSAIIGVTVSTAEEARRACLGGANYLGIGTVFSTPTKLDARNVIGTAGTRLILKSVIDIGKGIRTVCIGGINATNVQRVIYQSSDWQKKLDGVAVVSAIVSAGDPKIAAQELKSLIRSPPPFASQPIRQHSKLRDTSNIWQQVLPILKAVRKNTPLSHNMTNLVVQNFAANVALAVGASPIMANNGFEAPDLCKLGGSLVVNMGTVSPDGLQNYLRAIEAYNSVGGPIVLDPVGAGATSIRKAAVKTLMAGGYFDLIKGNEQEIRTVFGQGTVQQRGVDSGTSTSDAIEKAKLVRDLARRERNVVVMTGATDYVSDGQRIFAISNGDEYLGRITGSGCVLGTVVSAMLAVHREDKLMAAIAGLLLYEIAAEIAAEREDVKGPGTFVPALLDEIYMIQHTVMAGEHRWMRRAQVKIVELEDLGSSGM